VGRDYESIYLTTGAFCSIADSDEEALALVPDIFKPELRETSLVGSPATIRQRIAAQECLPEAQNLTPVKPICYHEVPHEVAIKPGSHATGMPTRSASIFLEENICLT
jgi:hypothetical protein